MKLGSNGPHYTYGYLVWALLSLFLMFSHLFQGVSLDQLQNRNHWKPG